MAVYNSRHTGIQIDDFNARITENTNNINNLSNLILSFTIILSSSSWSNNSQTVNNTNFKTSGYSYIISPSSSSFLVYTEAGCYADNISTNDRITFHCEEAPAENITVNIVRLVST